MSEVILEATLARLANETAALSTRVDGLEAETRRPRCPRSKAGAEAASLPARRTRPTPAEVNPDTLHYAAQTGVQGDGRHAA
jgi:hypothetical protein